MKIRREYETEYKISWVAWIRIGND